METTRLSSKGQVIIPKSVRQVHQWTAGQEFEVVNTGDGVLLRPIKPFPQTYLDEVAGCLAYSGTPKTLKEMEDAIAVGVREHRHDRR
jgi:AbrB family looped-hinge helix DNA binding protein